MKLRVVCDGMSDPTVTDEATGSVVEGVEILELTLERGKPAVGVIKVSGIGLDVQAEIRHMTD